MRKATLIVFLVFLGLLASGAALAETYPFPEIRAQLTLDEEYETVITPATISGSEAFLTALGVAPETLRAQFEAEGILLKAWDAESGRVLIVSALADVDGEKLYDINLQSTDARKTYRLSHSQGTAYKALGYTYLSAEWKNFGDTRGRFLMLKYSLKEDGEVAYRGYQRRTIRNGYTITLDVQVTGRQVTGADNSSMNRVNAGFSFTEILPMPDLPIVFTVTDPPPEETSTGTFVMKGKTHPGATLTAVLMTMSSNKATMFETTAKSSGAYALEVTLPADGVYYMTLTVEAPGKIAANAEYTITFQKGVIPFNLDSDIPAQLTENTLKISGTTISGVSVQLVCNGKSQTKKTGKAGTFSFTVDTSKEGEYAFDITLQKKDYDTRTQHIAATREYTEEDRRASIRDEAIKPSYANLVKKINGYDGRVMGYTAYFTEINERAGQYVITMALTKSREKYSNFITVTTGEAPGYMVGDKVKMYGTSVGMHYTLVDGGKDVTTPLFELLFFEAVE